MESTRDRHVFGTTGGKDGGTIAPGGSDTKTDRVASIRPPIAVPRHRWRRVLLIAAASLLVVCVGAGLGAWWSTPSPTGMLGLVRGRLRAEGARVVPLERIPAVMREAVVATEDERFYRHHGIDSVGLARAMIFDVSHASLQQGASTITEQLAKILYLGGDDASPWRKVQDAALALKIERTYSKTQILDAYLNSVYFGQDAVGIGAASRRFFARTPERLDLAQASLLAGLIQAPTADDPAADPSGARYRQGEVLVSMVRNGFITSDEAAAVLHSSLSVDGSRALPPEPQAELSMPPLLSVDVLLLGLGLLAAGAVAFVIARRHAAVWIKPAGIAALVLGLVVVGRSLKAA